MIFDDVFKSFALDMSAEETFLRPIFRDSLFETVFVSLRFQQSF